MLVLREEKVILQKYNYNFFFFFLYVGGGRKTLDPHMEKNLFSWIVKELKRTEKIIPKYVIKNKAKRLVNSNIKFKASKGWFDKFFMRYNIMEEFKKYENETQNVEVKEEVKIDPEKKFAPVIIPEKKNFNDNLVFKQDSIEHIVFFEEKDDIEIENIKEEYIKQF